MGVKRVVAALGLRKKPIIDMAQILSSVCESSNDTTYRTYEFLDLLLLTT